MNKMKRGFTLIEVMVSMFIVASLTAASYPYVIKKVQQSKAKKISLVVDDVARGAQNYYAEQDPKTWPGGDVCADAIEVLIDEGYMPAILDKTTGVYAGTRIIETECNTDKRIFNISVSTIGGAASLTNYQKTVNDMVRISRDWTSDSILTASDIEADESKFYSAIPRPEAAVGLSVITEDIIGEADGTTADSLWNAIRNGNLQEGGIDFDIKNASATTINGIEIHDAGGAGLSNVAIGKDNLNSNTTGRNNTVLGVDAGYNNSSGSNNVFIGNKAGYSEIGSNKLYISSTDTADPLIYGEFDTQEVKVNGNIEITGSIKVTGDLPPDDEPIDPLPPMRTLLFDQVTVTPHTVITRSHNIGAIPFVQSFITCKVAELGYSVGDKVLVQNGENAASDVSHGQSVYVTDTEVNLHFGYYGTWQIINISDGTVDSTTLGRWSFSLQVM